MIQSMDTDSTGQCVTKREIPSLKRRLKALATATFKVAYAHYTTIFYGSFPRSLSLTSTDGQVGQGLHRVFWGWSLTLTFPEWHKNKLGLRDHVILLSSTRVERARKSPPHHACEPSASRRCYQD